MGFAGTGFYQQWRWSLKFRLIPPIPTGAGTRSVCFDAVIAVPHARGIVRRDGQVGALEKEPFM